jgi:lipoate---protein ligase
MTLLLDNRRITEPGINLAIEEFSLRHLPPHQDCLFFYINQPAVILGKHQNSWQEADLAYAAEHRIAIIRRISGGGTVYHDPGNLNFCWITGFGGSKLQKYRELADALVSGLNALGVPAEAGPHLEIQVQGRKISGGAQYTDTRRLMNHGTLLFDSHLTRLERVLTSPVTILASRAVRSRKSPVANIGGHLNPALSLAEFESRIRWTLANTIGPLDPYRFSGEQWDQIHRLAQAKYRSWAWNFGQSPPFAYTFGLRQGSQRLDARLAIASGIISGLDIDAASGTRKAAAGLKDVLARKLLGKRFDVERVARLCRQLTEPGINFHPPFPVRE